MPRGSVKKDGKRARHTPGVLTLKGGSAVKIPPLSELPLSYSFLSDPGRVKFDIPGAPDFWVTTVRLEQLEDPRWRQTLVRCAAVRIGCVRYGLLETEKEKKLHDRTIARRIIEHWMNDRSWDEAIAGLRNHLTVSSILSS